MRLTAKAPAVVSQVELDVSRVHDQGCRRRKRAEADFGEGHGPEAVLLVEAEVGHDELSGRSVQGEVGVEG